MATVANDILIGGYKLLNLMMTGQTSQVWEVVEPGSGRHFALKLLLPENVRSPEHRQYLFHEAEVGISMHHPNVIKVMKVSKDKHNPYIIMEFFPGGNMKVRLMRKHGVITEKCHSILVQSASGFAHLNDKGWVHRDVKPDNVMVNSNGEVRVIDFALAVRINRGGGGLLRMFRKKTKAQGTRSYMSPEQILNRPLDERADLYSFGATMFEVVTGRPPFRGLSPNDLLQKHLKDKAVSPQTYNPEVTDDCAKLILRLLSKDKKDRPKDFHEFLSQFRAMPVYKGQTVEKTA